jgi:hypothetical protein
MARILAICWQIPALTQNLPFPPMNKHLQWWCGICLIEKDWGTRAEEHWAGIGASSSSLFRIRLAHNTSST